MSRVTGVRAVREGSVREALTPGDAPSERDVRFKNDSTRSKTDDFSGYGNSNVVGKLLMIW
jgi:hypothetical protein